MHSASAPEREPPVNLADLWDLDPAVTFLNHGSFGACPIGVLDAQTRWRRRLEREPVRFFAGELEGLLDEARARLGAVIGADPDDLAFVQNATTGVNTVLRAVPLEPGDEVLTTDHAYGACRNAMEWVAQRRGARVVVARVPFPLGGDCDVVGAVLGAVTPRTRLAVIDHVTSPTALVFPIARIVEGLHAAGVDVLVDGAHGPGMVDVDLGGLGAEYYTGNCHKWLCAPKGAGFLHVRRDRRDLLAPLVVSHGLTAQRPGRDRFRLMFDWIGTGDPTPYLSVPAALAFLESLSHDGLRGVAKANRSLAILGRTLLLEALGIPPPAPEGMLGSMAAVPLPDGDPGVAWRVLDPLQDRLLGVHGIEVPVIAWPAAPRRLLRISAQAYNSIGDYERLATALRAEGIAGALR
jgi:isopenicillin-N epimerase